MRARAGRAKISVFRIAITAMINTHNFEPRDVPIYSIPQAAQYLRLRKDRLRHWVVGWYSETKEDKHFFEPLIELSRYNNIQELPQSKTTLLSFTNLVEAHVLMAKVMYGCLHWWVVMFQEI